MRDDELIKQGFKPEYRVQSDDQDDHELDDSSSDETQGVDPEPADSSDEWLTTAGSSPMPSPPGRGYSDQSDPWMPMVVDRPSYYYPTGCGRGGAWPVKLGPARSSSGSSRWTVYIFFLSETDLHTRDFVHKSYESEITARDIDFLISNINIFYLYNKYDIS